jgi:hypothetical protein
MEYDITLKRQLSNAAAADDTLSAASNLMAIGDRGVCWQPKR